MESEDSLRQEALEAIRRKDEKMLFLASIPLDEELWQEILKRTDLEQLALSRIPNLAIPGAIDQLAKLQKLMLDKCELPEFPEALFGLKNLEGLLFLGLEGKSFSTIPNGIARLGKLRKLVIAQFPLAAFPEAILGLSRLEELELPNSGIGSLPTGISRLEKLRTINLSSNKFKGFPKELVELKGLERIDLSYNTIHEIPSDVAKLSELSFLGLQKTGLSSFPLEALSLKGLKLIHLANNNIGELPFDAARHPYDALILHGNPIGKPLRWFFSIPRRQLRPRFSSDLLSDLRGAMEKDFKIRPENEGKDSGIKEHVIIAEDQEAKPNVVLRVRLDPYESPSHDFAPQHPEPDSSGPSLIRVYAFFYGDAALATQVRKWLEGWFKAQFEPNGLEALARFFSFVSPGYEIRSHWIDYNKLLELKKAQENVYRFFDLKVPVNDLLAYAGAERGEWENRWTAKNELAWVQLVNFKIFKLFELELSERVNILLGNNGLGKTTVLQALALALVPIDNSEEPKKLKEYIHFGHDRAEIRLLWDEQTRRDRMIFEQGRPEDMVQCPQPPYLILAYGTHHRSHEDLGLARELVHGTGANHATRTIFGEDISMADPLHLLQELKDTMRLEPERAPEIRLAIDLLLESLNEFLALAEQAGEVRIYEDPARGFYFRDRHNERLLLRHLSEGYKAQALLMSNILARMLAARTALFGPGTRLGKDYFARVPAVILIDEFDRHLHPSWQQKLVSALTAKFRKAQFVLTTHNPFAVQAAVGGVSHQLKISETGALTVERVLITPKNIIGIIREYFTTNFYDPNTQKDLETFQDYLDRIDEGEIELVEDKVFLGLIEKLQKMGDEMQAVVASQIIPLNKRLTKLGLKTIQP